MSKKIWVLTIKFNDGASPLVVPFDDIPQQDWEHMDESIIRITAGRMTKKQLEALPEWEG